MSEQIEAAAAADMDEADVVEVVGLFENRHTFDCAVEALLTGGFQRTAISVLASHTSLEASAPNPAAPQDDALTALVGELSYAFPLESAGLLTVVGGPISGSIGALMAAGIGGMALKEYLDELTSHPDTDAFAKALEEGGLVIWVQVADDAEETKAGEILTAEGAVNVHLSRRVE